MRMNANREKEIDALKGIGILFVILGHCNLSQYHIFHYIYSFHMPIFFFVAGYLIANSDVGLCQIQKSFRKYIVPYWFGIVASVVFYAMMNYVLWGERVPVFHYEKSAYLFNPTQLGAVPVMNGALWFLPLLFILSVILHFIKQWSNGVLVCFLFLLVITSNDLQIHLMNVNYFSVKALFPALVFGISGVLGNRCKGILKKQISPLMTAILLVSGIGLSVGLTGNVAQIVTPRYFMAAFASVFGYFGFALNYKQLFLADVGRRSYMIYMMQLPLMFYYNRLFQKNEEITTLSDVLLMYTLSVAVLIGITIAIERLQTRLPITRKIIVFATLFLYVALFLLN